MTAYHDVKWTTDTAFVGERMVGCIRPEGSLYQAHWPDGKTAGPLNRTRAKDVVACRVVYEAKQEYLDRKAANHGRESPPLPWARKSS